MPKATSMAKLLKIENSYVDKFNATFKIGDKIKFRKSVHSNFQTVTVKSEAFMSSGCAVVFFDEERGYCSVSPEFLDYGSGVVNV